MRSSLLFAALGVALVYACGGDDTTAQPGDDDAGTDGAIGVDAGDGGQDTGAPPTPSPFGLDARPANATCIAKDRPVVDTPVKLQRIWPVPNVNFGGEGGLLGMAFHPNWETNRQVYLSYTRNTQSGDPSPPPSCNAGTTGVFTSVIARFTSNDGGQTLGAPDEIFKMGQPFSNHNGGGLQFGPDGMLYAAFGDGGSGDDPCGDGQNLGVTFGKFLRIDVNAGPGQYNIPPDNPFVNTPGAAKEIWSYGHRNPWRWSFDTASGDLWLGDVGQNTWEEIDRVQKGGNYGWNTCEGFHKRGSTTELCQTPGLIDPIVEHGRGEAQCIIGGYVYRGAAMVPLRGTYIYGDYATGNIWELTYDATNKPVPKIIANAPANTMVSFGQGLDGEVYAVNDNGQIWQLFPSGAPWVDNFPQLLSQTGCVDPSDATKPAAGVIPYDLNSPLWSDGAKKRRWIGIPDGKTIAINPDNDWDLPIGSVAMKEFSVNGKRIETRLFMRHSDGGWAGYSYEWNDQGTDAALLPAAATKDVGGGQTWSFPSRSQCIQCHSIAAGGTIGLETWQLNKDTVYPTTNRLSNELATLDHIGMFAAKLTQPPSALPKLPDPGGADALDARARSYMHANCSHCHRPSGGGQGTMDLRYGNSFKDTVTCNADPTQGQVEGVTGAKILTPGNPGESVLSLRVHATDSKRMPPVAVSIVDPLGSKLIDDWITSVTACP